MHRQKISIYCKNSSKLDLRLEVFKPIRYVEQVKINGVSVQDSTKPYIIAEMSGNHGNDFTNAEQLMIECANQGADAFKLQTYTPDSMTLNCLRDEYIVDVGPWKGRNLYDLYGQGQTPSDWLPDLFQIASNLNLTIFSTPFSPKDVEILEANNVCAYKVASFELTYIQLLREIARTNKPVIFSTGLATLEEISTAIDTLVDFGTKDISILKCTTSYPAESKSLNLATIPYLKEKYKLPVGFSDHTLGFESAISAATLGATLFEKHVKLDLDTSSVDSSFSLPVSQLAEYKSRIISAHASVGDVQSGPTDNEKAYLHYRRSIVANRDIPKGKKIEESDLAVVRPAIGLPPSEYDNIIGLEARVNIEFGEGITKDNVF